MDGKSLDVLRPGLVEAIKDVDAMALWECLRRRRKPTDLDELVRLSGRPFATVRAGIATLEQVGLVRMRKASGRRRVVAYEVAMGELSIVVDPSDERHLEPIDGIIGYLQRDLADALFRHARPLATGNADGWNYHHCSPLALEPDELEELKRRIARIDEFIRVLRDKRVADGKTVFCNHAISIRIQPLDGNVLPQPHVEFVSRRRVAERQAARGLAPQPLTPREREVARSLRDGASRAEAARRLGISALTVDTLCKRIYRKLGIRRAADLHHFSLS